jgi:sulfotransferase family protein
MPDADGVRVVFIAGMGRSGTTLVERMLGELPGVCPAGEVVHLWQRGVVEGERCGCGEAFHSCAFWQAVGVKAFGGWDSLDTARVARLRHTVDRNRFLPQLALPWRRPGFGQALDEYVSCYHRVYTALAETSGCGVVVDSSKHASLAFCLRGSPGPQIRVIHVVRDSRAVAYSWATRVRRPDSDAESYMSTRGPVAAAMHWNAQNGAVRLLARLGTPTLRVAYEDVVRDPAGSLRTMAAFAGLDASESALGFIGADGDGGHWAELRPAHTVSGNPLRFRAGRIPVRGDERWRAQMSAPARSAVTALTFPLLRHYRYLGRNK